MPVHTPRPPVVSPPTGPLTRLHVTVRRAPDIEPPYDDTRPPVEAALVAEAPAPYVQGALALVLSRPAPEQPAGPGDAPPVLRLVAEPAPAAEQKEDKEHEADFSPVRTPRSMLPPPGPRAVLLVRAILEVLAGVRPVAQLMRCTSEQVYAELESRVGTGAANRPWAGSLRQMRLCEPVPGVAEVAAVIQRGTRMAALALRLEGVDGRWLLTAVRVG